VECGEFNFILYCFSLTYTHTDTHTPQPSICTAERDGQEEKSNTPEAAKFRELLIYFCPDYSVFFQEL